MNMNLRTGSGGRLAVLANRMFVGVGRMLTNEEGVHCIEYTLSELVPDA